MANWEDLRIMDAVEKIQKEEIVLPVIQRELVWDEEKIVLLFDTVLRGDSFGAIMTLKDWNIKDYVKGTFIFSTKTDKLSKDISYVIEPYLDLLSEWDKEDFYLDFASYPQ